MCALSGITTHRKAFLLFACRRSRLPDCGLSMQYFTKGAASFCGVVELINEEFSDAAIKKQINDRLMPRTEELPIYNMHEFNDKVEMTIPSVRRFSRAIAPTEVYRTENLTMHIFLKNHSHTDGRRCWHDPAQFP